MYFVPKIKVCGITNENDIKYINENLVDYAGFVLFFSKSKRNISIEQAKILLNKLKTCIKKVAVVVSPTMRQVHEIEEAGFDLIQVHGRLSKDVIEIISIPIFRAFNVTDLEFYEEVYQCDKIKGYVFDAHISGSGKTFDWSLLNHIKRDEKLLILAGGLNSQNINRAIKIVNPDIVDVSSGVEDNIGKNNEKIKEFVRLIRHGE